MIEYLCVVFMPPILYMASVKHLSKIMVPVIYFSSNFLVRFPSRTTIVALVCAILFTGQKAYIEKISANEDTMLNDKYLYDTFFFY